MKVRIPGPLRSYTKGASAADVPGDTLGAVLQALDSRYPGIRFRAIDEQDQVRPHIKLFINTLEVEDLEHPLGEGDEVMIVCALSGG